jgi:phenylacetate-coenzyme A ligase PaaK-like adenylate-forming protein
MKTFLSLREQTVFKKSIDRIPVEIKKQGSKFVVFVDGDKLDHYKSQPEAEKMAAEFIKQFKG